MLPRTGTAATEWQSTTPPPPRRERDGPGLSAAEANDNHRPPDGAYSGLKGLGGPPSTDGLTLRLF